MFFLTRAELRVVLVKKLAEEEASVSGYETMEKESWNPAPPPCLAFRASISRLRTRPSNLSTSWGVTSPLTSDSRENCKNTHVQSRECDRARDDCFNLRGFNMYLIFNIINRNVLWGYTCCKSPDNDTDTDNIYWGHFWIVSVLCILLVIIHPASKSL